MWYCGIDSLLLLEEDIGLGRAFCKLLGSSLFARNQLGVRRRSTDCTGY